jgi:hypothetical protein
MIRRIARAALLGCAIAAFCLNLAASVRWLVVNFTYGNRHGCAVHPDKAILFFSVIVLLAALPWLSKSLRQTRLKALVLTTILNVLAFAFTGALLLTGCLNLVR